MWQVTSVGLKWADVGEEGGRVCNCGYLVNLQHQIWQTWANHGSVIRSPTTLPYHVLSQSHL